MPNDATNKITDFYGLRRDNFILDPLTDTECFARDDIKTPLIAESLDIDLVTGLAPKRLVWGPYGGGKTHTLMRTMEELEKLTRIHPTRIECPDLSKKSRFHDLYREGIMRGLGQDFIIGLVERAVQQVGLAKREEMVDRLKTKFGDEEFAKASIRLIDPNFDQLRFWRWISGGALSRDELNDLGQTQDLTSTEAARLADIVCMFGRLLREQEGETLVLILDEMERLHLIGPETVTTFISGFTRLVDPNQRSVSILIGASAAVESEMIEIFNQNGPVTTRLGSDAQIEIPALQDPDVDKFIIKVIEFVRDPAIDVDKLLTEAKKQITEEMSTDFFPFTGEAIEALKSRLTQVMTPREITLKMTRAVGRAFRSMEQAVSSDYVA